jgi:ActR/RegA family two-component response regulator
VLILDDDDDLRETLAQALHVKCRVDCLAVADVDAMIALGDRALACELAILDVNLGVGKPSGIDAHAWLLRNGFSGRIAFLTGHAKVHTMVQEAIDRGTARVLQKPTRLDTLCELVPERE